MLILFKKCYENSTVQCSAVQSVRTSCASWNDITPHIPEHISRIITTTPALLITIINNYTTLCLHSLYVHAFHTRLYTVTLNLCLSVCFGIILQEKVALDSKGIGSALYGTFDTNSGLFTGGDFIVYYLCLFTDLLYNITLHNIT